MSRYQLTEAADADVADILRESERMFGPRQRDIYAEIIGKAAHMVASEPEGPASRNRDELLPGARSFHLELAAGRRGGASHHLYFMKGILGDGNEGTIILRVLHERMDPHHHIKEAKPT